MQFTMVYWMDSRGTTHATRVFTEHVAAFITDVEDVGGLVFESEEEGN